MLRIANPHAGDGHPASGADPCFSGREQGSTFSGGGGGGDLRLGRPHAQAARLLRAGTESRKGYCVTLPEQDDGIEPEPRWQRLIGEYGRSGRLQPTQNRRHIVPSSGALHADRDVALLVKVDQAGWQAGLCARGHGSPRRPGRNKRWYLSPEYGGRSNMPVAGSGCGSRTHQRSMAEAAAGSGFGAVSVSRNSKDSIPTTAVSLSITKWRRCYRNSSSNRRSPGPGTRTITVWWNPRTAPWCASTWATCISKPSTPSRSRRFIANTSIRISTFTGRVVRPDIETDAKGKQKRVYRRWATPWDIFRQSAQRGSTTCVRARTMESLLRTFAARDRHRLSHPDAKQPKPSYSPASQREARRA